MAASLKKYLGHGLYTIEEASFYARLRVQTMGRWLFGNRRWERVYTPEIVSEEKLVSFVDLIQSLAIRAIRVREKISLQKIRQAMELAEKDWGVPYPFAREHTTFVWGDKMVIRPGVDAHGDDIFIEASGRHRGGRLINKVVEIYLRDVCFDNEGLAYLYRPFSWDGIEVKMDPKRYFGEPLMPSRHTARTLWEASEIEGGLEQAAKAYGVDVREVETACRYFDYLVDRPAA